MFPFTEIKFANPRSDLNLQTYTSSGLIDSRVFPELEPFMFSLLKDCFYFFSLVEILYRWNHDDFSEHGEKSYTQENHNQQVIEAYCRD